MGEKCERDVSGVVDRKAPDGAKSDGPHRGRGRPNEHTIVGCGPEVILDAVPKGRTAQIEAAINDGFRTDAGLAPALIRWNGALSVSATIYMANRDYLTEQYLQNCEHQPGSSVGTTLKSERGAALSGEIVAYDNLGASAQSSATFAGPTFAVFELADRSYRELITSMVGSGHARAREDGIDIDGKRVASENSFHREQAKDALLDDRSKGADHAARALDRSHQDLGLALTGARAATLLLRRNALNRSASEDQVRVDELQADLALWGEIDTLLGTVAELSSFAAPLVDAGAAFDFKPVLAEETALTERMPIDADKLMTTEGPAGPGMGEIRKGGGLLTRFVQWVGGNELARLRARVVAKQGLATDAKQRAELIEIEAKLAALDVMLRRFAEDAVAVREDMEAHRKARTLDGQRLDKAARDRGELGPGQELHVPIATRLARLEGALALNTQAQQAALRMMKQLLEPAAVAGNHRASKTAYADIENLRQALPPNVFLALRANLSGLLEELAARGPELQQLVGR